MCGTAPGIQETDSTDIFNNAYEDEYGQPPPMPFMTNTYDAVILAVSHDEFIILEFADFEKILEVNYNVAQLKKMCRHWTQQ